MKEKSGLKNNGRRDISWSGEIAWSMAMACWSSSISPQDMTRTDMRASYIKDAAKGRNWTDGSH